MTRRSPAPVPVKRTPAGPRSRTRALAALTPLALLFACSADTGDLRERTAEDDQSALVGSHVYAAPSRPTKSYPAPSTNAVWASPTGNDATGDGTQAKPFKTLGKAVQVVNGKPAGPTWTVVLTAGTYREGGIVITRSNVTLQRNGTDAVSLWGTVAVGGFAGAGPYTTTLTSIDTAPLVANCADDHLNKGDHHYGAEQAFSVIRAGVPLQRVAAGTALTPGQYSFDPATKNLTLNDAPASVEVVRELWAIQTRASNVRIAGLDVEGYGTCAVDYRKVVNNVAYYNSSIQFFKDSQSASGNVIEGSTIANNAAAGLVVAQSNGVTIADNRLVNNGWDGAVATASDGLVVRGNVFGYNNFRRWANSVEAGMKVSHILDGVVFGNVFEHNAANGFWCDQGCGSTDLSKNFFVIAQNVFRNNDAKGLFYEVSHHAMIASNLSHDNGSAGIAAYGSRAVQIWNNTLVDNNASTAGYLANLSIVDDTRCAAGDTLPGGQPCTSATPSVVPLPRTQYDHCAPSSDGPLANTCNSESIVIVNNIISGSASTRPLVNVSIPAKTYSGSLAVTRGDYQSYYRPSASAPFGLIEWQKDATGSPLSYASLATFRAAIAGREASSIERVGGGAHPYFVDYASKNFAQKTSSADVWGRGQALPTEVLKAVYWPATAPAQPSARVGAIDWAGRSTVTAPPTPTTPTPPPTVTPPPPPASCDLATPVYHVRNPGSGAELFTLTASEATNAKAVYGYTDDRGVAFDAATSPSTARVAVYRLYNPTTHDRLYTTSASEKTKAASTYGYTSDEGIGFYAAASASTCLSGVHRLISVAYHTYATSATEVTTLKAQGWTDEGVVFFAGAP